MNRYVEIKRLTWLKEVIKMSDSISLRAVYLNLMCCKLLKVFKRVFFWILWILYFLTLYYIIYYFMERDSQRHKKQTLVSSEGAIQSSPVNSITSDHSRGDVGIIHAFMKCRENGGTNAIMSISRLNLKMYFQTFL